MNVHKKKEKTKWVENIEHSLLSLEKLTEPVSLSLILPVYNCSEVIGMTLESVARQEYESLEIIVVDGGSKDRTLEIVNSYAALITRVYSLTNFNLSDMLNRGISFASSEYVSFLLAGSYYLSGVALQTFACAAVQENFPDLIYCGSIQREIKREPGLVQFPFSPEFLRQGRNPATLSSCWFRRDLFQRIGKFNNQYKLRSGFEFFCRAALEKGVRIQLVDRVYVDFDYGRFSYGKALRFASETGRILSCMFGVKAALIWFLKLNHFFMVKWLWLRFKQIIFNK